MQANLLRATILLVVLPFIGACATPERTEPAVTRPDSAVVSSEQIPESKPSRPRKEIPTPRAKSPGPIPTRALNVVAECRFRDETGYGGTLRLSVKDAQVQAFEAAVVIPRRGTCRFDLKNFRQTRDLPNVELNHRRAPCIVRLWEQDDRVTVAFQQCRKMCSGTAWEHLWPILNDRRDGTCA